MIVAPMKIFNLLETQAKTWFMESKGQWNSAITIGGMDYNEFGESEEESKHKLANRILGSTFLLNQLSQRERA